MIDRILDKNDVRDFLDGLAREHQVFAPVDQDGTTSLEPIATGDGARLSLRTVAQSPKQVFFPRSETLFVFEGGEIKPGALPEVKRVVFGVRPCDARAAAMLDDVFVDSELPDPYYAARRDNTVLIGLACDTPPSTCFCTAVGGGPFGVDGLDLLFTDLGERYLVESVTERGEALVANDSLFREAAPGDRQEKAALAARAEGAVSGPDVGGLKRRLDGMYDDPFWDAVHQKCLGCGICSFLCPTCHCFDIADEGDSSNGRRVRNWDSCQFSLFTYHASGHNPRPSGRERMRQRIMHKFRYFVDNFGETACVGCGRCVRACPVNLDIRAVIADIQGVEET
jgi:ferredoxin